MINKDKIGIKVFIKEVKDGFFRYKEINDEDTFYYH